MILAIDPGLSGGVGVVTDHGGYVAAYPMPTKMKSATKRELDAAGLCEIMKKHVSFDRSTCTIVLERQRPFPGQGVSSMFSLGDSVGVIRGICASQELTLVYAEPQTWKKWYRLKKDKEQSRGLAIDLYPMAPLSRKKDEGVAEALLIARWYAMNGMQVAIAKDYIDAQTGRRIRNGRPVSDELGTQAEANPRTSPSPRLPRGAGSNPAPRRKHSQGGT